MKCTTLVSLALASALVASCRTSPDDADDYLDVVDSSELVTVDQAALRAEQEITAQNLEREFAKLQAELDADR
jgi:hypothetical protein